MKNNWQLEVQVQVQVHGGQVQVQISSSTSLFRLIPQYNIHRHEFQTTKQPQHAKLYAADKT